MWPKATRRFVPGRASRVSHGSRTGARLVGISTAVVTSPRGHYRQDLSRLKTVEAVRYPQTTRKPGLGLRAAARLPRVENANAGVPAG